MPIDGLSFVATDADGDWSGPQLLASKDRRGRNTALLLGPLPYHRRCKARASGGHSCTMGSNWRRTGARLVILVGDEPYYARVGFPGCRRRLILPGPVDPERFLYLELQPGALDAAEGLVLSPARFAELHRPSRYHMADASSRSSASRVENSGNSFTARTR